MTREDDINLLAKALCDSMVGTDRSERYLPWNDLHEFGRDSYRRHIRDLLTHDDVLQRLVFDRARDDGTAVAFGGEPGASAGDSE